MPRQIVGASERIRISRAGCVGGEGSGALKTGSGKAALWQAPAPLHSAAAAMVSCHSRNAALERFLVILRSRALARRLEGWPGRLRPILRDARKNAILRMSAAVSTRQ